MAKIEVENHGSIFLLRPVDKEAKSWLDEHAPEDAQFWGRSLAVEPRYVENWIERAVEAGIEVDVDP